MMRYIVFVGLYISLAGCGYQVIHVRVPSAPIIPESADVIQARTEGRETGGRDGEYITTAEVETRFRAAEQWTPRVRMLLRDPVWISDALTAAGQSSLASGMASQGDWRGVSYYDKEGTCVVIAPRPRHSADIVRWAVLGHELSHCYWGLWHAQPDAWGMPRPRPVVVDSVPLGPEDCVSLPATYRRYCRQSFERPEAVTYTPTQKENHHD